MASARVRGLRRSKKKPRDSAGGTGMEGGGGRETDTEKRERREAGAVGGEKPARGRREGGAGGN
jgi:hypothetical protein